MQNGVGRVDIGEKEVETAVYQSGLEQVLGAGKGGGGWAAIEAHFRREASSELGVALGLAQLGQDLCATPLGALFLWDCIVGAGKSRGQTVLARICAFANAFYFPSVAATHSKKKSVGSKCGV